MSLNVPAPHFLLFSEAGVDDANDAADGSGVGQWRFVLESVDGATKIEAADAEPRQEGERLELLAIVRGLEALDQPSRVTLVTSSRYVSRGLRFGLENWRENDWQWERYGQMTPIKNSDLWRRIDQAMQYHLVECRSFRCETADDLRAPHFGAEADAADSSPRQAPGDASQQPRVLRFDRGERPATEAVTPLPPKNWLTRTAASVRSWFQSQSV